MKTVLVVAYHFPPEEGSCSEKNTRIVKLLLDSGFQVKVLTKPGHNINDIIKHKNLTIIRTDKTGILHRNNNSSNCSNVEFNNNSSLKRKLKKIASRIIVPDGTIDWFNEVKHFLNQNKDNFKDIDVILSISSPYSAHLVSKYISKQIKVPYIMSYGDPWIYEPKRKRGFLRYRIEYLLEKYLIKESSGILVITKWNKDKYIKLYNIPDNKIQTYHIGYDKADSLNINNSPSLQFRIIYGGSLDPVHRNPDPFLSAIVDIDNINVKIFNSDNTEVPKLINKYAIGEKVSLSPIVKSSEFMTELYKNDALLLFGNRTPFQVPGKVFTYIATGKTIIYLKNNDCDDDGTEKVLIEYGNCIILKNEKYSIKNGLNEFISSKDNENRRECNSEIFEFHNTMYPIVQMINAVINER